MTSCDQRCALFDAARQALDLSLVGGADLERFDREIGVRMRLAQQDQALGRLATRASPERAGRSDSATSPCSSRARQAPQLPPLQLCGRLSPASSAASSTGWSGAALKLRWELDRLTRTLDSREHLSMRPVSIVGCGYLGLRLARRWRELAASGPRLRRPRAKPRQDCGRRRRSGAARFGWPAYARRIERQICCTTSCLPRATALTIGASSGFSVNSRDRSSA